LSRDFEDAEDAPCEEFSDGRRHAREAIHEEGNRLAQKALERLTVTRSSGKPRVGVVEHVDENNAK